MTVYTVGEVIKVLSERNLDESLAITWWSSEDVEANYPQLTPQRQREIWEEIVGEISDAIDSNIRRVNDILADAVSEQMTTEEIEAEDYE